MHQIYLVLFTLCLGLVTTEKLRECDHTSAAQCYGGIVDPDLYIVILKEELAAPKLEQILSREYVKSLQKANLLPRTVKIYNSSSFHGFCVAVRKSPESEKLDGVVFENTKDQSGAFPSCLSFLDPLKNEIEYIEKDATMGVNAQGWFPIHRIPAGSVTLQGVVSESYGSRSVEGDYAAKMGNNTIVYVLDTGCNARHQEFNQGQILHTVSIIPGTSTFQEDPPGRQTDQNGHGTHVCSIIAGTRCGIAKNAKIISIKIFNSSGKTSWALILDAFAWIFKYAKNHPDHRHLINLSLNGTPSRALKQRIQDMYNNNFLVFVAAGNQSQDACYRCPSCSEHVISVGAVDSDLYYCPFSNYGACVDILAQGSNIIAADYLNVNATTARDGTSMACPQVTASAAIIWSALLAYPAPVVRCMIIQSAVKNTIRGLPPYTPNRLLNPKIVHEDFDILPQCLSDYNSRRAG